MKKYIVISRDGEIVETDNNFEMLCIKYSGKDYFIYEFKQITSFLPNKVTK